MRYGYWIEDRIKKTVILSMTYGYWIEDRIQKTVIYDVWIG